MPVRGERLGSSRGDLVRAAALVAALRRAGHDVLVVEDAARASGTLAVGGYRAIARRVLPRRLALIARDAGRVLHARGHARACVAAGRAFRPEVLVETQVHFSASGAAAARALAVPLILDDCSPASEEAALGCGLPGLALRVLRRQAREAGACFVPSEALCARLRSEGVPADRLRLLPNGLDVEAHARARAQREAQRARLDLDDRVALAFVGSFQPWHAVDLLGPALARTTTRGIALVLVGDGPGRAACVAAIRSLEGVRLVDCGPVAAEQVPPILAACDVGVLPGTNDYGQPMKLLEYAAAGLALVAPDVAPVREMLRDGATGMLFAPGDATALGVALERVVADSTLRARLADTARREIVPGASWDARASRLIAVASELLSR